MSDVGKRVYFIEWLVFTLLFTLLVGFLLCRKNFTALVESLERDTPVKLVLHPDVTREHIALLVGAVEKTPGVIGVDVVTSATLQRALQQQEPWSQELDTVLSWTYPVSINVAIDQSLRNRMAFASALVDIAQLDGVETLMYDEKGFDKSRKFVRFVYQLFHVALVLVFLSVGILYCATRALGIRGQYNKSGESGSWVEENPAHFTSGTIISGIVAGLTAGIFSLVFLWGYLETANLVLHSRLVFFTLEEAGVILFAAMALRVGLDVLTIQWKRA